MSSPATPDLAALERRIGTLRWIALSSALLGTGAFVLAIIAVLRVPRAGSMTSALPARVDELTVSRINVIEPDGTPRMIIASRARFPGVPVRGKEFPHPNRDDDAGILFVNDEGTENGGLVQSGLIDPTGKVNAGLSLTFDRFRQDQVVQLTLHEDGDEVTGGLVINDVPSYKVFSIDDMLRSGQESRGMSPAEREAARQRREELGHTSHRRGYFGIRKGVSQLVLSDPQGRPRLTLSVSERGEPSIVLLDEAGRTVRSIDTRTP